MSRLSLALLPPLKDTDIFAEDEASLAQLDSEARVILASMPQVVADTEYGEEFIAFRLQNLLRAIGRARELGGGVWIG